MKLHFLLGYLCVILFGGALIAYMHRGEQVKLVALREVPANHLLQPGDLALYTTGKQYVTRHLDAGAVVESREISAAPEVTAKKGFAPFALAVDPKQVFDRTLEAGQTMIVCPLKVKAEVRAVFCSGDADACFAVLHVADADLEKLKAPAGSKLSLRKACE
jgi:hypothetical protein